MEEMHCNTGGCSVEGELGEIFPEVLRYHKREILSDSLTASHCAT